MMRAIIWIFTILVSLQVSAENKNILCGLDLGTDEQKIIMLTKRALANQPALLSDAELERWINSPSAPTTVNVRHGFGSGKMKTAIEYFFTQLPASLWPSTKQELRAMLDEKIQIQNKKEQASVDTRQAMELRIASENIESNPSITKAILDSRGGKILISYDPHSGWNTVKSEDGRFHFAYPTIEKPVDNQKDIAAGVSVAVAGLGGSSLDPISTDAMETYFDKNGIPHIALTFSGDIKSEGKKFIAILDIRADSKAAKGQFDVWDLLQNSEAKKPEGLSLFSHVFSKGEFATSARLVADGRDPVYSILSANNEKLVLTINGKQVYQEVPEAQITRLIGLGTALDDTNNLQAIWFTARKYNAQTDTRNVHSWSSNNPKHSQKVTDRVFYLSAVGKKGIALTSTMNTQIGVIGFDLNANWRASELLEQFNSENRVRLFSLIPTWIDDTLYLNGDSQQLTSFGRIDWAIISHPLQDPQGKQDSIFALDGPARQFLRIDHPTRGRLHLILTDQSLYFVPDYSTQISSVKVGGITTASRMQLLPDGKIRIVTLGGESFIAEIL